MKILVCGAGSIGKRHIVNLLELGAEVTVWRSQVHLLKEIQAELNVQIAEDLDSAIKKVDAVVVATATDEHIKIATAVMKEGKSLFVEKPISNNWEGIDQLSEIGKDRIVEVGCQFRAHPNLIFLSKILHKQEKRILTYRLAMGHRLDAWRVGRDYKSGYSANAARGGGALFDLIHQIDIALWLFGSVAEVSAVLSKRSGLEIQGDDITNILLTHKNGITGHIQLDMASPVYRCEAEIMTEQEIFLWSYMDGILISQTSEEKKIVDKIPEGFVRNNLFLAHMNHFLERIRKSALPPLCSLDDGISALRIALCARESFEKGKRITI